jgi:hypothetical protein
MQGSMSNVSEPRAVATGSSARPKSKGHLRAIYGLGREKRMDNDELHQFVLSRLPLNSAARKSGSFADLTFAEAQRAIAALKGNDFVPLRTLQYRRQKAGIKQMVQKSQLDLIVELATQRNWTADTLEGFCLTVCKHKKPRTTADANKVIEGLKAMNRRDQLWAA